MTPDLFTPVGQDVADVASEGRRAPVAHMGLLKVWRMR